MKIRFRIPVADDVLTRLVLQEVEAQIESRKAFTAYNITRALRRKQPQLEIAHKAVRQVVHLRMRAPLYDGSYEVSPTRFGIATARLYIPVTRHEPPRNLPLLPLDQGKAG